MSKAQDQDQQGKDAAPETSDAEPVRTPRVTAGPCPRSKTHTNTRVYNTKGVTRYCVCDDCGETWKRTGPLASAKPAKASA